MITHRITYSSLAQEGRLYQAWANTRPIPKIPQAVAREGAGSESRTPLMHYGTVLPVYLGVIRYLSSAKVKKGDRLIELGSGTGRLLAYLKHLFPMLDIYGVDYSQGCIDYATKFYSSTGVHFKKMKPGKTPYPDESFRFVISSHVIEHVKKEAGKAFLDEVYRLLVPQGMAFIGTPERRMCQNLFHKNPTDDPQYRLVPPHEHEYTLDELQALAKTVFPQTKVTVDKLSNPVFHNIFLESIKRIRPGDSVKSQLTHSLYKGITNYLPRTLFDTITRTGAQVTMMRHHVTFSDILLANKIDKETSKKISDNLLLICQK